MLKTNIKAGQNNIYQKKKIRIGHIFTFFMLQRSNKNDNLQISKI